MSRKTMVSDPIDSLQRKTALITGASGGIGEAFARALAARGMHLILVARSTERLRALAEELSQQHGIQTQAIAADLASPGAAAKLKAEVDALGLRADWLVNNAGVTAGGRFGDIPLQQQAALVQLNVVALTELSHLFLPQLLEARGALINVASIAAFLPGPYYATYGGSKAYVLSFTQSLWEEYRKAGLKVLAVCPGPTQTNIFAASGNPGTARQAELMTRLRMMMTPEAVVEESLRALEQGRTHIVNGVLTRALAQLPRAVPRSLMVRAVALLMKPQ